MLEEKSKQNPATGGQIRLFCLAAGAEKSLAEFMKNVVWGCELPDSDTAILKEKFSAIGLNFEQELLKRGRQVSPNPTSIKTDYGDLAEVIGYYIETEIDGADPQYLWARNIHCKTVSRVSLSGIDGIAVNVQDLAASEPLQPSEGLTICEWKHTEKETVVKPAADAAAFIAEISVAKLLQELKLISKNLKERGETNRSARVYLFALDFAQKSTKVKLNCAILGIKSTTCAADIEKHYHEALKGGGWPSAMLCGNVVEVDSVKTLAKDVYEHLTH